MAACTDWSSIDWNDEADTAVVDPPGTAVVVADEPSAVLVEGPDAVGTTAGVVVDGADPLDPEDIGAKKKNSVACASLSCWPMSG